MSTSPEHHAAPPQASANANVRTHRDAARPSSFAAIPGWVMSGMFHAGVILFLVTSGLPSCGNQQLGSGADQGDFREVGIYIKQPENSNEPPNEDDESEESKDNESTAETTSSTPTNQEADDTAAELIDLPEVKPRGMIGQSSATPPPVSVPSVSDVLVQSNGGVRAPQSAGEGPGEVSFLGQSTPAQQVVYVIDTSSSMDAHDAMGYAKAKLKQSINGLNQKQRFQIIAYTHLTRVMRLRADRGEGLSLYPALGSNLRLASRHIDSLEANGGTKHMPALEKALAFEPDVIFFLSDADSDLMSRADLEKIRRQSERGAKTQIHCFQFGQGPDLQPPENNFMRTIASENRGTYAYFDVKKLDQP